MMEEDSQREESEGETEEGEGREGGDSLYPLTRYIQIDHIYNENEQPLMLRIYSSSSQDFSSIDEQLEENA